MIIRTTVTADVRRPPHASCTAVQKPARVCAAVPVHASHLQHGPFQRVCSCYLAVAARLSAYLQKVCQEMATAGEALRREITDPCGT